MAIFGNLSAYRNTGLLLIRLGLGAMFIYHGLPKLQGGIGKWTMIGGSMSLVGIHFLPAFWGFMAAATEALGGVLLILGLAFRPVCLLLVINLAIAALFHFHKGAGWEGAAHAVEDAIMFAGLFIIGPGRYSIDKK